MKKRLASVYIRLIRYAMSMSILGGIASFIGPLHHRLIKAWIGVTVGAMLLGNKLPNAMKELSKIINEITDDMFQEQ